jgi:hypothetical protein
MAVAADTAIATPPSIPIQASVSQHRIRAMIPTAYSERTHLAMDPLKALVD